MTSSRLAVSRFAAALEDPIDLGRAATLLGLAEDPSLDVDAVMVEFERLGAELAARLPAEGDEEARLRMLGGYLFGEVGLLGNERDYYDPRNSYVHQVLRRGLGIPISLSVIAIEVGRRAGLDVRGIGFPAHFLVGTPGGRYLDPFHQGRLLSEDDCAALLLQLTGQAIPFDPRLLAEVDARVILLRMLRNLKGAHLRRSELDLVLADVDRLLLLDPSAEERRDRGLIQLARRDYAEAVLDLEAYLETAPSDALVIQPRLDEARRRRDEQR